MQEILARFKDAQLGKVLLRRVREEAERAADVLGRLPVCMEVCGTHTMAISRAGLHGLLRDRVVLQSGPGCPVCVTDQADIDACLDLARRREVTLTTFGDLLRVPGSRGSLEEERAGGADVRVVYSPSDAVDLAAALPERQVVFVGVGFETTAPLVALSVREAATRGLTNYSVYPSHKLYPPALRALLLDPEVRLDAFLLPGHASTILGRRRLNFIAAEHGVPGAIAGFEPLDVLSALLEILRQLAGRRAEVVNTYPRLVREEGNPVAVAIMAEVFTPSRAAWRGLGELPGSGLEFKGQWVAHDAIRRFQVERVVTRPRRGCLCGEILRGKVKPFDCGHFGRTCTPVSPLGPCMVSSEGACAAYYRYERTG